MAKQKTAQRQDSLERMLIYILGHRPDEFGLMPDGEGFISIKELLAALHDEDGFRGVREGQIVMLTNQPGDASPFEIQDKSIRLKGAREKPPQAETPPKTLWFTLKPSAWQLIHEKGLHPKTGEKHSRLWVEKTMAEKVGRRISSESLLIAVNCAAAQKGGATFEPYSELLWLAAFVPAAALSGPPPRPAEEEAPPKKKAEVKLPISEPAIQVIHGKQKGKYGDEPAWKQQTRRDRRKREE